MKTYRLLARRRVEAALIVRLKTPTRAGDAAVSASATSRFKPAVRCAKAKVL